MKEDRDQSSIHVRRGVTGDSKQDMQNDWHAAYQLLNKEKETFNLLKVRSSICSARHSFFLLLI